MPRLTTIAKRLRDETGRLAFGAPVTHVYKPLEYAWRAHRQYLLRYGDLGASVLLLGMNPGPFGMTQTGVPFGEVEMVRDWLRIEARIDQPEGQHPKRPITGFDCTRSEVSGRRLWGWASDAFATAEQFFARFFVWNYCPLVFMEETGRNRTPDKLSVGERQALYAICDESLRTVVACLRPTHVIGVGRFAGDRAASALGARSMTIGWAPHPSPASPAANRGWAPLFTAALRAHHIGLP